MDFVAWPKTPRLFKDCTISEKIDGTNAGIIIEQMPNPRPDLEIEPRTRISLYGSEKYEPAQLPGPDHTLYLIGAQSRNRLITPEKDNAGFARWVFDNAAELVKTLGLGRHFGEWWGLGIQRGYGMGHKKFSLFNTHRYAGPIIGNHTDFPNGLVARGELGTVPVLYRGPFVTTAVTQTLEVLRAEGSQASPGFDRPEGVIVYHSASKQVYKAFVDPEDEAAPKGSRG